jgi:hypothetical protein
MNTIVMTGATSGIGKVAAEQIRETPRVQLVIGARVAPPDGREVLPLDLGHLESVRAFVQQAEAWLGDRPINGLVLNAATQFGNIDQRTEDGFETTFAVNHLAHYLLLRLLTPRLAQNAIVVITTSNSHDPLTNPVAPPTHADALRLARPRAEPGRRMRPVLERRKARRSCDSRSGHIAGPHDVGGQALLVLMAPGSVQLCPSANLKSDVGTMPARPS